MVLYNKPKGTYWDNEITAAAAFGAELAGEAAYTGAKLLRAYMSAKKLGIVGNTAKIVRYIVP